MTRRFFTLFLLFAGACTGTTSNDPKGGNALGFAIINSDYKSTSVSLVDPTKAALAQDDCLDSGSTTPQLSMALSGDVVMATAPQANDELVLVDRMNSALAYLSATNCQVLRQVSVATGYYSNPHDVVSISPTKSYVTRYEKNATPSGAAGAFDQGDDLLIFNPATGTATGRIDLSSYAMTGAAAPLQARPDRALLVDGKVYVTLTDQSADFMTTGPAVVVVIDSTSDLVTGTIPLSAQKNCSGIDYLAASKTLVVGCSGDYNDPTNQSAQSGVVLIDISGSVPKMTKVVGAADVGGRALGGSGVVGDDAIMIITAGDVSGTPPDSLWSYTVSTATAQKVLDADGAFTLGSIAANAANHLAFVTDASMTKPVVHVFDVSRPAAVTQTSSFVANPKSGLPPRLIGWY